MPSVAYGSLSFKEQIAFFRAKKDVLTESWLDVFGAEHDVAFMVAGANRTALLADLRGTIDKTIAESATLAEFRKDFDRIVAKHGWDYKGGRNWRSRVIYETNLRQSYNAGRWAQLQRLKTTRPYWQYKHSDAVMHPRPLHQSWDGLVLHADDPWWHTHFPANGWGCFLPGTRVQGDIQVALRCFYSGPAIEIESQRGSRLRVTANHPILTGRGWLPAGAIHEGDQLLNCVGRIDPALTVVIDHEQAPPRVEDAFDALATHGLGVAEVSPHDLHGDALFGKSEIEVASSDRQLHRWLQATRLHRGQDRPYEPTDACEVHLAAPAAGATVNDAARFDLSHPQDVIHPAPAQAGHSRDLSHRQRCAKVMRDDFLLDRIVRRSGGLPSATELSLHQDPVARHLAPAYLLSLAPPSDCEAPGAQEADDGLPGAADLRRELLDRNPGLIAADQVARVRKFEWTGHVFDFQTANHLIVANGIVAHNCQCYVQALSERDLTRLGKAGPDKTPPIDWDTITIGQRSPGGPRQVQTPRGVDPGFGYAPGRSLGGGPSAPIPHTPPSLLGQLERAAQHALQTSTQLPARPAAQTVAQVLAASRAVAALDAGYAAWQSAVMATRQSRNLTYLVGTLDTGTVAALASVGVEPSTAAIVARDVEILHALRDTKARASVHVPRALTAEELARLPAILRTPRAVVWQKEGNRLLYVIDAERRDVAKVAIAIDCEIKTDAGRVVVNSFRTAGLVDLADLRAGVDSRRLVVLAGSLD